MPPSSDLAVGLFAQLAGLDSATRLYELRLADVATPLAVEGFRGREALSELFELRIDVLTTESGLDLEGLLGRQLALLTRLADGSQFPRTGYIRGAEQLAADGGLVRYRLTVVPWLWFATRRRHDRVFQEKTVLQIVEEVFAPYAPRAAWRAADEVESFLQEARPRAYCVQRRESDYEFVARLLAEEGLGYCFEEVDGDDAPPGEAARQRLVIFSDAARRPDDVTSASALGGQGIRFHRASSQEDQDAIQAFGALRTLQAASTVVASYDYKAKRVVVADLPGAGKAGGPNAPQLESFDHPGAYAFADAAQAGRYARLLREAIEARNKGFLGASTVRSLRPGTCLKLTESPAEALDGAESQERRFLVTEVEHLGLNNLPKPLAESLAALLGAALGTESQRLEGGDEDALSATALARGYANRFGCVHAPLPWRPLLVDGTGARSNPRPTVSGPETAVVVGPEGETSPGDHEIYTDKLGRIKVKFHWQKGDVAQDRTSCWLRVAQRYAHAGMGTQFIPRIGQEVLVDFLGNDVDRPLVIGALYNGRGEGGQPPTPGGKSGEAADQKVFTQARDASPSAQANLAAGHAPPWHGASPGAAGHRNAAALGGFKTKEFSGAGYNQLVFDDSDSQLRVQLKTTQAATELNLGHLIHQAENYRGSFRGRGFELRTDAFGALRAGKGLLLTTYHGSAPDGAPEPAGDFTAGAALLKQATDIASRFSQAASTHQTVLIAAHAGAQQANHSAFDAEAAPLKALHKVAQGQVECQSLEGADSAAGEKGKSASGGAAQVPHLAEPVVALSAKAGLAVVAGQNVQLAHAETITWASGQHTDLAVGGALRLNTGQALGMLAGAVAPGEENRGFSAIAAQGPIVMQAQADTMALQARDAIDVASANAHIDFAAAKSIKLAVAGGASLTIEGGNIRFECPGTITIHASQKSFTGPTRMNYALPKMPQAPFDPVPMNFTLALSDLPGKHGAPRAFAPWHIFRSNDGANVSEMLFSGQTDAEGQITLTAAQQEQLAKHYAQGPGTVWVKLPGQARQLDIAIEREQWTTDQKTSQALAALDYAPVAISLSGDAGDTASGVLAKSDTGRKIQTLWHDLKKR